MRPVIRVKHDRVQRREGNTRALMSLPAGEALEAQISSLPPTPALLDHPLLYREVIAHLANCLAGLQAGELKGRRDKERNTRRQPSPACQVS